MADLKKFVEDIKGLSVVELNDLVKMIEEEFGVSAAAVSAAPTAAAGAAAAEAEKEQCGAPPHLRLHRGQAHALFPALHHLDHLLCLFLELGEGRQQALRLPAGFHGDKARPEADGQGVHDVRLCKDHDRQHQL